MYHEQTRALKTQN